MTKRQNYFVGLVAGALLFGGATAHSDETVKRSFFICGWNSGGPTLFTEAFEPVWTVKVADEPSDAWLLPDGGLVCSFSKRKENIAGVIRLDKDRKQIWKYTTPVGVDNHSCQPLPHGGFLLGESSKKGGWMVELDAEGNEIKRVKVLDRVKDIHHTFRMVRKTKNNTYLATLLRDATYRGEQLAGGHAYEWDESGKLIHTFPSGFFYAIRLPNGNTLVSEGSGRGEHHTVVTEYAPDNSVVWELNDQDMKDAGFRIGMVCGLQRLPNGNTVVSNVAHGKHFVGLATGEEPKAFEMTPDKKVVWKVPAAAIKGNMGSLQMLDVAGDPFKLEIFR
jgi:hypothetical protein